MPTAPSSRKHRITLNTYSAGTMPSALHQIQHRAVQGSTGHTDSFQQKAEYRNQKVRTRAGVVSMAEVEPDDVAASVQQPR